MKTLLLAITLLGAIAIAAAQDSAPAFEVATVKPNKSGDQGQFIRLQPGGRQRLLVVILGSLALLLAILPQLFHFGLWVLAAGVGVIGFLVYGPYSLLGGVLSVEVRGKEFAATVSGLVDGTGYFAGVMSGTVFGKLLMQGGYRLGFQAMAGLTLVAAVLCCFLYRRANPSSAEGAELKSTATTVADNT